MEYEWDDIKSETCFRERGFDFAFASLVFGDHTIEWTDLRFDYPEARIVSLGRIERVHFVVVYCWRGEVRRIISARRAKRGEANAYRATFGE